MKHRFLLQDIYHFATLNTFCEKDSKLRLSNHTTTCELAFYNANKKHFSKMSVDTEACNLWKGVQFQNCLESRCGCFHALQTARSRIGCLLRSGVRWFVLTPAQSSALNFLVQPKPYSVPVNTPSNLKMWLFSLTQDYYLLYSKPPQGGFTYERFLFVGTSRPHCQQNAICSPIILQLICSFVVWTVTNLNLANFGR